MRGQEARADIAVCTHYYTLCTVYTPHCVQFIRTEYTRTHANTHIILVYMEMKHCIYRMLFNLPFAGHKLRVCQIHTCNV